MYFMFVVFGQTRVDTTVQSSAGKKYASNIVFRFYTHTFYIHMYV